MQRNTTAWIGIIAAITTVGAVGIALGLGAQLISYLLTKNGYSEDIIGYNGAIGGAATIFAAALSSILAVHFGVVKTILLMLLIGAASFIGFYFTDSITIWFILRFCLHFSTITMFVLSEFWINQAAPINKRGFVIALYSVILGCGFALGSVIPGFVGTEGIKPFLIGLLCIVSATLPISLAWKHSPTFQATKAVPFKNYIFSIPTSTVAVFIYGAIQLGALSLLPRFSHDIGYSDEHAAYFMTALAIGNTLLIIPIGILNDYFQKKNIILFICSSLGAIGTIAIPLFVYSQWLFLFDLFLLGGVSAALYTLGLAQIGDSYKDIELVAANSAFAFCYGMGTLLGPALIGAMMKFFGTHGFSLTIAGFFILYCFLVGAKLLKMKI